MRVEGLGEVFRRFSYVTGERGEGAEVGMSVFV